MKFHRVDLNGSKGQTDTLETKCVIKSRISKNGHPFKYYVEHALDDIACAMVLMMDQAPPPSPRS